MEDLNDKVFGNLLTASEWNQVPSEIQNIIEARGIALSSSDLNQLGKGVAAYASNGSFYTDSGPANAYVLTGIGTQETPSVYEDGMEIAFFPNNDNTGASTVNVAGLGVRNIKNIAGTNPTSGVINTDELAVARYDIGTGTFRLTIPLFATTTKKGLIEIATNAEAIAKSATDKALVPSNLAALNASETATGLIEIATQVEVDTGTDDTRAVTPLKLASTSAPPPAGTVNQAALKTAIGEVSTTGDDITLTLPGGEYGFYPQIKQTGGSGNERATINFGGASGSYLTRITLTANTGTAFAQQRYVQASPPYDLGDGAIQLFVYVLIDKTTNATLATYSAPDPVWANNGPTIINPLGKRTIDPSISGKFADAVKDPIELEKYLNYLKAPVEKIDNRIKATQAYKNADMDLIPHPFPDFDPIKQVVVMLDPISQFNEDLFNIHEFSGDSIAEILHGGNMFIDNTPLGLTMPKGVIAVTARFK